MTHFPICKTFQHILHNAKRIHDRWLQDPLSDKFIVHCAALFQAEHLKCVLLMWLQICFTVIGSFRAVQLVTSIQMYSTDIITCHLLYHCYSDSHAPRPRFVLPQLLPPPSVAFCSCMCFAFSATSLSLCGIQRDCKSAARFFFFCQIQRYNHVVINGHLLDRSVLS